nr:immunoglobulin light chain junction region [Macaca mulatta]MOW68087.1 immunoglobulin light chain junction region [Macaca mulatta]MOW71964.1 immunoglobulin light chain junction region [Macaca mulatta]MOW72739.1 immunoglobulin light chain junction region [Macaca mulatta]
EYYCLLYYSGAVFF